MQLNRRLRWEQSPPDMNDYAPDCLKAPTAGIFAVAAPANGKKRAIVAPKDEPRKSSRSNPVVAGGVDWVQPSS